MERARYGRIERGELNKSLNVLFGLAASLGATPSEILASINLTDGEPDPTGFEGAVSEG